MRAKLAFVSSLARRRISVPYWLILTILGTLWLFPRLWRSPDLTLMAAARLMAMHKSYDSARDHEQWGLQVGDTDLHQYTHDLKNAWTRLFGYSSTKPIPWASLHSRLALNAMADPESSIPHRVYTTSNFPPTSYPEQFRYWAINDHRCVVILVCSRIRNA